MRIGRDSCYRNLTDRWNPSLFTTNFIIYFNFPGYLQVPGIFRNFRDVDVSLGIILTVDIYVSQEYGLAKAKDRY